MAWSQESPVANGATNPLITPAPSFSPTPTAGPVIYEMKEVVVHAEKEKGDIWEGPALEKVRDDGNLSSFLGQAGGVETQGLGGAKTYSNASIRGASPEQTLILLNGQRTNPGFDLGLIPTGDIERIEILKGPDALAYGSEAMGGVINIITRPKEGGASLGLSGGDFNTWQVQGDTGRWKAGSWEGSLNGSWYQTGGYTINTDEVSGECNQESDWTLGEDHLSLKAGYVYKNGGSPNGDSLSAQDTGQFDTDDREKKNAVEASLQGEHPEGGWTFRPSLSYSFADIDRLNPLGPDAAAGVPIADENIYNTFSARADGSAQWDGLLRSFDGYLEFQSQNVQGTEGLGGGLRWDNESSLSARGSLAPAPDLQLDLSARLDWYHTYGLVVFNPEGTLRYNFAPDRDVYLEAGTGFRYPGFDELFHPLITYIVGPSTPVEFGQGETGNPDLKPESSVNLETGTDCLWGSLLLRADGFLNFFSNMIVPAENNSDYWTFLNWAHVLQAGAEIGVRWGVGRDLTLRGDYTYVDSRDSDTGQLVPARLRQKFSLGLDWTPAPGAHLNLDESYADHNPAVYNGPQDSPPIVLASSYWVLNTGFQWDAAKDTSFFLTLDNLFNQTYATFQGLPMPGRDLEIGTKIGL